MNTALPTHDAATGEPFSGAFVAARARALELQEAASRLHVAALAEKAADPWAPPSATLAAAEKAAQDAVDEAYNLMLDDRERVRRAAENAAAVDRQARALERERERLAEQENATLARILLALRDRGPLTGGELEALRIRGASHNLLRPILRVGVERGLIRKRQDGRRVLWSAVPQAIHSSA